MDLTLIVSGASHAPFLGGFVRLLSEGPEKTVLLRSPIAVSAPTPGLLNMRSGVGWMMSGAGFRAVSTCISRGPGTGWRRSGWRS